eukprot:CAMPEP_0183340072 /NCGR_PEP_ID=MMETSP0164_2-20130417/6750_1 /TAXON_ID=221442 /ORGANISM="Coccolithus pelagicus ssp braarudi, Strain PLY182g" /LENGTH=65 /DNA_ID=CAMNT_0025510151 /DNA_START=38 /DNA_END=231 /DNA_ORIENTATION=+
MYALVTGGARGLGLEIVSSMLTQRSELRVFLCARSLAAASEVADELCTLHGSSRAIGVALDVTCA